MADSNESGRYRLPGRPARPRDEELTNFAPVPPPPLRQSEQPWIRQPLANGASPYAGFPNEGPQLAQAVSTTPTVAKLMHNPRMVAIALGVALLAIALVVLGASRAFSSGAQSYANIEELHQAVVSAGEACGDWAAIDDGTIGQCVGNDQESMDLRWFSSTNEKDTAVSNATIEPNVYWVVGPNWIIDTQSLEDAVQLQKALHAKAINFN